MSDLSDAGVLEATACDAGLVLSELISNALRHATPLADRTVRICWRLDGDCLEIAVSDGGGPTVPAVNEPGHSAIGGRGLSIVDRLSLRWGVETAAQHGAAQHGAAEGGNAQHSAAEAGTAEQGDGGSETTVWAKLALYFDPGRGASDDGLVIASSRDA